MIVNNAIDSVLGISHNPSRLCNNCKDEAMMDNILTNPSVNGNDECIFNSNPPYFLMKMIKLRMRKIEYKIADGRPGDIATCYADAVKAKEGVRKYFEERHFMRYEFSNAVRFALSLLATLVADGVGGEVGVG